MNKIYLFIFALCILSLNAFAQPTTSAATPPVRNTTDVISLFSDAYTTTSIGINWFPDWGQSTTHSDIMIGSDNVKRYANLNYEGVQFASNIDASNMKYLHFDIWTADCTSLDWFLINLGPTVEQPIATATTLNGWTSVDIDLTTYTSIALHKIGQFKLVGTPAGSTIYLDNIYFYKSATTPTITNFSIPPTTTGAAPFAITAPTSNSVGAFTYSSTNASVATVSGNTITVVGQGTTTIKAIQVADGAFIDGSISTSLTVAAAVNAPTVAATTPTQPAANVISLFSNAYTNVPVDTWKTNWTPAPTTLTDLQIAGNDTKLYGNLDFVGIEFVGPNLINATTMNHFHIDVWTPNATTFSVKLVDFGADGVSNFPAAGDDVEHQLSLTPLTQSGWNSFDIPLSSFTGLTTRAHMAQLILVGIPVGSTTAYIDNVYFHNTPIVPPSAPTVAAPTPTNLAANVISLYSNAYTNVPVDTWSAGWDAADVADVMVAGNDNKLYTNLNLAGVEFTTTTVNATNMEFFHIDVWSPNATEFKVKLVDFGANGTYQGGDDSEHELTLTPLTQNAWNSYNIPLSSFTGLAAKAHLAQMLFIALPSGTTTAYIDNVYFYKVPPNVPMVAAATPPNRAPGDVISIYSDVYAPLAGVNMSPVWGQPIPVIITDTTIEGNPTKKYANLSYQGTQLAAPINLTTFEKLHIDFWTPNCTSFIVSLINQTTGQEDPFTITPTLNGWNSVDILLSEYTSLVPVDLSAVSQLKFEATPSGTSTIFLDNLYFHKGIALPIVLASFDATKKAFTSVLDWKTTSETNNKGFYIQRSKNATNWENLTFINGAGNSSLDIDYTYTDNKPSVGVNYYRLKQVDFDGRFTTSDIKALRFNEKDALNFTVFPNPTSESVYIDLNNFSNGNAVVNLINEAGKIVYSKTINVNNGAFNSSIKVNSFAKGNYILQIKNNETNISKVLVIE